MDGVFFAQNFPFSASARNHLKKLDIQTNSISSSAIKRAELFIEKAFFSDKDYAYLKSPYPEDQENNIVAFPVAKMIVSAMNTPNIIHKFANYFRIRTFSVLQNSLERRNDDAMALASDFGIHFSLSSDGNFFEVPLVEYLSIHFMDDSSRLINRPLEGGVVSLNADAFSRFVAELSYSRIFDSLPISRESIPKPLLLSAKSLDSRLVVIEKREFDVKLSGKIDPELFPPCLANAYTNQLAGKKLSYMERLTLGGFLHKLGMSKSDLLVVFSKSPDYDRKIAEYHIDRIIEKDLDAPGFKKIHDEYGMKTKDCDKVEGKYRHPIQFYLARLAVKNRMKNMPKNKPVFSGGGANV